MAGKKKERRTGGRTPVSYTAFLAVDDITVSCVVENISVHGAYLNMGEPDYCAKYAVGDMVTLTFPPETGLNDSVRGRILRHTDREENCFVAVYFTESVTFI